MTNNYFSGRFPTKITFEDDSFDLAEIEINKDGQFSMTLGKEILDKNFNASVLDKNGNLRELKCEVKNFSQGEVLGSWIEIESQ